MLGGADEPNVLVTKSCVGDQSQTLAQLCVVAQLGVRVQGQVVGKEVDVMRHQARHTFAQPTRQTPIMSAPEQTVVHEQCVSARSDGSVDERQACRDS